MLPWLEAVFHSSMSAYFCSWTGNKIILHRTVFEDRMNICNDAEGENMFNHAIQSKNTKKIMGTMKGFNGMPKEEYNDIAEIIPLKNIIEQKNNYVEPLIANSMVPAISDRWEDI